MLRVQTQTQTAGATCVSFAYTMKPYLHSVVWALVAQAMPTNVRELQEQRAQNTV